jgi:hypothetical protein
MLLRYSMCRLRPAYQSPAYLLRRAALIGYGRAYLGLRAGSSLGLLVLASAVPVALACKLGRGVSPPLLDAFEGHYYQHLDPCIVVLSISEHNFCKIRIAAYLFASFLDQPPCLCRQIPRFFRRRLGIVRPASLLHRSPPDIQ